MPTIPAKFLEWTPEYTVHDADIDREHQALFDMVDRFHAAMLSGQGKKILKEFHVNLTKFAINHFADEES